MLRSLAKDAAARVTAWTGLGTVVRETSYIVGYHRVVDRVNAYEPFALPAMEISVPMFEKHLDWLGKHFEILSLNEAARTDRRRSKPSAAVTFDDGYRDTFLHAFPILKRKGIPATFFVMTDLVGGKCIPVHDRLYAAAVRAKFQDPFSATQSILRHTPYDGVLRVIESLDPDDETSRTVSSALLPMTWEMLAEMRDAGMTIGSHSKTHAFLTNETPHRVQQEVRDSRTDLRTHLGIEADVFAYPGGDFNGSVVEAVRDAGYRLAFTVCRHRDNRYPHLTIRRRGLWQRSCVDRHGRFSPAIMSTHSAGIFGRSADCPNTH